MHSNNLKKDNILSILFFSLTLLFIALSMTNRTFFDWIFDRHHNQWSWYIRPLFLIPFCYFSFKRRLTGVAVTIFCLFTSMFWFPRPEIVDRNVIEFLKFEKDYLYGLWNFNKILMTLTIPISFFFLGFSFWRKSLLLGMCVIVLMSTGKIVWSIQNAGESGKSILIPAIIGIALCCGLIYFGFKKIVNK